MTLVLKAISTDKKVEIPWSREAVDYLIRQGVRAEEESNTKIVFCVSGPYAVEKELLKAL